MQRVVYAQSEEERKEKILDKSLQLLRRREKTQAR